MAWQDGLDPKKSPLIKYNQSRQKIQTRVAPVPKVTPMEDDQSENEQEASVEGDEDQVEDFVMSD